MIEQEKARCYVRWSFHDEVMDFETYVASFELCPDLHALYMKADSYIKHRVQIGTYSKDVYM